MMNAVALLLWLALAGFQDPKDPVLEGVVESAFEGPDEELPWSIHVVTLSNLAERDLDVVVTLSRPPSTRIVRTTAIARRATVRLQFFAPNVWAYGEDEAECEVRGTDGRVLFRRQFRIDFLRRWGGAAVTPYLAVTGAPPVPFRNIGTPLSCRETHFPQRAIGLRGLAFVLLRDARLEMMVPAQLDALREWVAAGGTLILCPGANPQWLASEGVRTFARVELGGSETRTLQESAATFAFHRILNGRPLRDDRLAVEYPLGAGRVIVTAVDLESPPFDRWAGRDALVRDLLERRARPGLPPLHVAAGEVLSSLSGDANALPPFLLLFVMAVAFVALVGPVNWLALRRAGRPQLLLLTIPAGSAVLVLVVIATGYVLRGASTLVNEVVLLDAKNGATTAVQTRALSLFSPASRAYAITFPGTETALPAEHDAAMGSTNYTNIQRAVESTLSLRQQHEWSIVECGFAQWQARSFVGRTTRDLGRGVRVEFDGTTLRVANGTPWRIARGFRVEGTPLGARILPFGEVPAGETREFAAAEGKPELSPVEERALRPWLDELGRRRLVGRLTICTLDGAAESVSIDASVSSKSQRSCLLQIAEDNP